VLPVLLVLPHRGRLTACVRRASCTLRLMSDAGEVEYVISGVVVMRHHDRHPALHHHGLGKLELTEGLLRLLVEPDDHEVASGPYDQVTLGTSPTTDEFATVLFLDFPGSQWTIDFATVDRQDDYHHDNGELDRKKLVEYQLHLEVADFEAGVNALNEFVNLAVAGGVKVADDSDRFEDVLAKWRGQEVRWDEDLGWSPGGAE